MSEPVARSEVRLAELLAVLSLATDLGMGQPMEHVLRQCLLGLRLAGCLGLDEADREVVYYTALVAWVGCHVDAYEQAKWFGDDTALKADYRRVDFAGGLAGPLFMLRHLGAGRPIAERARLGAAFPGDGRRAAEAMLHNHWLAADGLAARLGLPQPVRDSVEQTFERWDGKGVPNGIKGEAILLTSRLVALADVIEVFHRAGGTDAASPWHSSGAARSSTRTSWTYSSTMPSRCSGTGRGRHVGRRHRGGAGARDAAGRRGVRRRAGGGGRLHRRQVAVHHRSLAQRGRPDDRAHRGAAAPTAGSPASSGSGW